MIICTLYIDDWGFSILKIQSLKKLLSQITPYNIHQEVSTGNKEGREAW